MLIEGLHVVSKGWARCNQQECENTFFLFMTIAHFTVSFSHLYYNIIQCGWEAISAKLKLQNSPKLPHVHARFQCNVKEQS